jgi:aminomethyltransferase
VSATRPRVLVPGLLPRDPARETYRVRPGAQVILALEPGDEVVVRDVHGGQAAFASSAELGVAADLFGPESAPGAEERFEADRRAELTVSGAPEGTPVVEGGVPASDVLVEVVRASPRGDRDPVLPEPLAEPRLDFEVPRASALAYEVKAGEYIQVIDVQGRQCSDLLAFHWRKLQDGNERGLDSTTTRSLMGNAYPNPGLYGKFYDQDQEPLVEVVRDTVGRHDTFGLACYAKYYEDLGYFGHVNCTDNFNAQLLPYTIAPRKGWPALNLFYNTSFDSDNLLISDEPWSRPGDYVLLRAMTDLVCLSSACPDDIDPANAWNPTEIHVRVYPAKQRFTAAIAHRVTPDAEPKLTKDTGFRPRTGELTGRFTDYNGYWLPTAYDNHGAVDEYWACRERAAIMDLSPLRKWEVLGPDAEELLQSTMTRDIRRLADGQVVYTALCNDTGGMIDDGTVFRLQPTNFRFVGGSEWDGVWLREQAERRGLHVWIKESTDELHNVAVQGPASRDLLSPLIWTAPTQTPFAELGWFRFSVARIGGPQGLPLIVSRTG